jgi:multidrug efflux system membrane fusion protein
MRYTNVIRNSGQWAIVTVLTCWLAACGEETEKDTEKAVVRPAKIFLVGNNDSGAIKQFPGKVRAAQQVDMSFNFAGTLSKLPIKEGHNVEKGQLLAQIDPRDYRNTVAAERAKLKDARASYVRHKQLLEQEVTTPAEYDKVVRRLEVQKVELKIAEKALSDTSLNAPFSGRVAIRYVDNFKEVQAKEPVVSLQDITSLEMVVNVPESMIAPIRERGSLPAFATFPVVPGREFPLEIREFASQADPQTQTYRVVLAMPAPKDVNILPGMTTTVWVNPGSSMDQEQGFLVPVAAVFADEAGARFVWKIDKNMKVQKTQVEVGEVTGSGIKVTKGLESGDKIVSAGVNYLEPGQQISELKKIGN